LKKPGAGTALQAKPMRIAILGATSQIAKDLIHTLCAQSSHELVLYARRPQAVTKWLDSSGMACRYAVADFTAFSTEEHFDAILNFIGVGNPAQAAAMGASIFDITLKYDEMALAYVQQHPTCRYIFLSSGAAYGASFDTPVDANTKAVIDINHLQPQDWYAVAKLHAECRHRSLAPLPIVDLRVFNYFSHTQDMSARFLMTDIIRALQADEIFITSPDNIVRDFIDPEHFHQLITRILGAPHMNAALDCYTKAPVEKMTLLSAIKERYGLVYQITGSIANVNATGFKRNYYSVNHRAEHFGYMPNSTSLEIILQEIEILTRSLPECIKTQTQLRQPLPQQST
jgi:nucleoside-diphosphate-sugar epimerase